MNSNRQKIYKAVIIGAGRIASGFDTPRTKEILTHAHAVSEHSKFMLLGMSDIDTRRGEKEARKWGTAFYDNTEKMLKEVKPDAIIIATPDHTHAKLLDKVSRTKPKLIICEKPVLANMSEMSLIAKKVVSQKIPILVNFSRRFDSTVCEVRDALMKGKYGKVISAHCVYTNGILHNGSHALDLARFLFGDLLSATASYVVDDRSKKEPSVAGFATFKRCSKFSLTAGDERAYAIFEFDILTEKKYIRFENFGFDLVVQGVVPDPIFKGFRALGKKQHIKTGLVRAMEELYDHAALVLEKKTKPISSLEEGLKTQAACFKFLSSI